MELSKMELNDTKSSTSYNKLMVKYGSDDGSSSKEGYMSSSKTDDSPPAVFISDELLSKTGSTHRSTSTINGGSITGSMTGSSGLKRPEYVDPVVAEREEKIVLFSRVTVVVVLLIAVSIVSTGMYSVVSRSEKAEFENQFANYVSEISSVVQDNAKNAIDAAEAFSATITSYATATNSRWPFVRIQDYSSRAQRLRQLSKAKTVNFLPLVNKKDAKAWTKFVRTTAPAYYKETLEVSNYPNTTTTEQLVAMTTPFIFNFNYSNFQPVPSEGDGPYLIGWHYEPLLELGSPLVNFNLMGETIYNATFRSNNATKLPSLDFSFRPIFEGDDVTWMVESQLMQPIFDTIDDGKGNRDDLNVVGTALLTFDWSVYFQQIVPEDTKGIDVILTGKCNNDSFTYRIDGWDVSIVGVGDLHDTTYDELGVTNIPFARFDFDEEKIANTDHCISEINMSIYPTKEFEESFYTKQALQYSLGIIGIFAFTSLIFFVYDVSVRRRQSKVMARIIRQDKIVTNMFPEAIRDRLYDEENAISNNDDLDNPDIFGAAPLAELYPNVTVIFADISGFTAWSSQREPPQVFKLLESIYSAFDKIAYRHGVFKIETVGDCYVAVAGLPEARCDHALVMAKFARDCVHKMSDLTQKLEMTLGPDTADLELRVGMNSGQVTAGVIRGERSRFQLFGDTVNTAARMESTGCRSRIQVSASTADALRKDGRRKWLSPREDTINVKGKGNMQTYWLETKRESAQRAKLEKYNSSINSKGPEMARLTPVKEVVGALENDLDGSERFDELDDASDNGKHRNMNKMQRLVEWNVEVLSYLLQQIVVERDGSKKLAQNTRQQIVNVEDELSGGKGKSKTAVLEEFKEIITLPIIGDDQLQRRKDPKLVELSPLVVSQLRHFITKIAQMYRPNSFHNFEHASHVTASVRKLLTRIVNAENGNSYGITSDPLTQFAVVLSAVIHDADHPGVPNTQLVKENTLDAQFYKKSIAEQNSVDLVWALLMSAEYKDLRACIYSSSEELRRFRQLVVNTVMATDICDKDLNALRKARWATAFSTEIQDGSTPELDMNRKATIVIEHLIQASDVSHTMQHWHIYKKWNERFFFELYGAYKAGRAEIDPSIMWYKGEIGFFDFYIIPLAKKLDNCGVFGVSSHEYLNYATSNREEWVREGEKIVQGYLRNYHAQTQETSADEC